jgi:polysaccharide pyruvyl transferase WcaK-like protein
MEGGFCSLSDRRGHNLQADLRGVRCSLGASDLTDVPGMGDSGKSALAMRILIDQSGYDLLNIGDVAMLQSCVARLKLQWPDAEIMVIAHESQRLESYCPGAIPIGRTLDTLPLSRIFPRRLWLASEQARKTATPYFSCRFRAGRALRGHPRTAIQAVQAADVVVASGGGYVTDTWWWHAAGVLGLLSLAQRLGKPTAMFGQGLGPIGQRTLRAQASSVLPKLKMVGLREDRIGRDLLLSMGLPSAAAVLTGDDALELIGGTSVAEGSALGINVRVSGYAGVDSVLALSIGDLVVEAAEALGAPIIGLPVSRYGADADVEALRVLFNRGDSRASIVLDDITSPEGLVSTAASCRAIVTGSYHAAVFGLAQGVPTVCLTKSSYYNAKFGGLQALFPGACFIVPLDAPDFAARLQSSILEAWSLPVAGRIAARNTAACLRDAGRAAYAQFRVEVENSAMAATSSPSSSHETAGV